MNSLNQSLISNFLYVINSSFNMRNCSFQNLVLQGGYNLQNNYFLMVFNSTETILNEILIINCTFSNFSLFFSNFTSVKVYNSSFYSNKIQSNSQSSIFSLNDKFEFSNVIFNENELLNYFFIVLRFKLEGKIKNCNFLRNAFFGLIYFQDQYIEDFSFEENMVSTNEISGNYLIYISPQNFTSGLLFIISSTFSYNMGQILIYLGKINELTVKNINFISNYGNSMRISDIPIINISQVLFYFNQGVSFLPGIYIESTTAASKQAYIDSLIFEKNSFHTIDDKNSLGVSLILVNIDFCEIKNSSFIENTACFNISSNGDPGIVFSGGTLSLFLCSFVNNKALTSTLAINFKGYELFVNECLFKNNMQIDRSFSTSTMIISAIYELFNFSKNICIDNYFSQGMITLANLASYSFFHSFQTLYQRSYFARNGHFYLDESKNRTFLSESSYFLDNYGEGYSTTLYVYIYSKVILENITFQSCIMINNTAVTSTLLVVWIYSSNVYVNLINTLYLDSKSYNFGGPLFNIFGLESGFYMFMNNCIVYKSETKQAGVFWLFQLDFNITNSHFINNYVETTAGVFYLITSVRLFFINGTITQSLSSNNAGSVYCNDNSMIYMRNITISDCLSMKEIVLIQTFSQMILKNVTFTNFTNDILENLVTVINTGEYISEFQDVIMNNITSKLFLILKASINIKDTQISLISNIIFIAKTSEHIGINSSIFKDCYCENQEKYCLGYGSSSKINIESSRLLNYSGVKSQSLFYIETLSNFSFQNTSLNFWENPLDSGFLLAYSSYIMISQLEFDQSDFFLIYAETCFSIVMKRISSKNLLKTLDNPLKTTYINIQNSYDFFMNACYFEFFNFTQGFFLVSLYSIDNLSINSSYFSNIFSQTKGSVLNIVFSKGIIQNNVFMKNSAERGSSIYFRTDLFDLIDENYNLIIENNRFEQNTAKINGAGVYFEFYPPILKNNICINNSAQYAADFSSFPFRLSFSNLTGNSTIFNFVFLPQEHTGALISTQIKIFLLDAYNNEIFEDVKMQVNFEIKENLTSELLEMNNFSAEILGNYFINNFSSSDKKYNNNTSVEGKTSSFQESDFSYLFNDILLKSAPESLVFFKFSSSTLQIFEPSRFLNITQITLSQSNFNENEYIDNISDTYYLFIPINITECFQGEIYIFEQNICQKCGPNTYSLSTNDVECYPCAEEAVCLGGADFSLNPGYWRSSIEGKIYRCDTYTKSCLGGFNSICERNYKGILCDECQDSMKIQKKYNGLCEECKALGIEILILLLLFLALFVINKLLVDFLFTSQFLFYQKASLKIFMDFFHFLNIIQIYHLSLPHYFLSTIVIFTNLAKIGVFWFSFSCIIEDGFGSLLEGMLVTILILVFCCLIALYSKKFLKETKDKLICRVEFFIYMILPSYIDYLYSKVICIEIDGKSLRIAQKSSACWDLGYYLWFFLFYLPLLIFCAFILPFILFRVKKKEISLFFKLMLDSLCRFFERRVVSYFSPTNKSIKKSVIEKFDSGFENAVKTPSILPANILKKTESESSKTKFFFNFEHRNSSSYREILNHFIKVGFMLINRTFFEDDIKHITILLLFIFYLSYELANPLYKLSFLNLINFLTKLLLLGTIYGLFLFVIDSQVNQQYNFKEIIFVSIAVSASLYIFSMIWIIFMSEKYKNIFKRILKKPFILFFKK